LRSRSVLLWAYLHCEPNELAVLLAAVGGTSIIVPMRVRIPLEAWMYDRWADPCQANPTKLFSRTQNFRSQFWFGKSQRT